MNERKIKSYNGQERIILKGEISDILPVIINKGIEPVTAEELARNRMFSASGPKTQKLESISWLPFVEYFLHYRKRVFAEPSLLCECVIYTSEGSPDLLVRDPLFYTFPEASREYGPSKYDWAKERKVDLDSYLATAEEDRNKQPEDRRVLKINLSDDAIPIQKKTGYGLELFEFIMPEISVADFDSNEITRWLYRGASADYKMFCLKHANRPSDIKLKIWRAKSHVFKQVGYAYAVPLVAEPQLHEGVLNHQFSLNATTPSLLEGEYVVICKAKER